MKFAVAALVATTSAIQIRNQDGGCTVPQLLVDTIFKEVDTNNNGQISINELAKGAEFAAKAYDHKITDADKQWVGETFKADAGEGGPKDSLNKDEFDQFINKFTNHFGLCGSICVMPP